MPRNLAPSWPRGVAVTAAAALFAVPVAALACRCDALGDVGVVEKVQSSWPAAYTFARAGDYKKAIDALRSTAVYIRFIHDDSTRTCVAAGAQNLIASATAGKAYLVRHPGDVDGAKSAATRAWHVYLNCP